MTVLAGFFGKIPTRGDFVRAALPGDTVAALDAWCQDVLPASRALLGGAWTDAWMEAPIWRFMLPAGTCGAAALAGLWLPSTDKAGRLFPLVIALAAPAWRDLARCGPFLDTAESIGLTAVEQDVSPPQLAAALTAALAVALATAQAGATIQAGEALPEPALGTWWTAGTDRVAATTRRSAAMPDGAAFAAMLRD